MSEPTKPTGAFSFFAAWMLLHEKADDWLRDSLKRANETPEEAREGFQEFLVKADGEKEALKAVFGDAVGTELKRMGFIHKTELAKNADETEALKERLKGLEALVDRLRDAR